MKTKTLSLIGICAVITLSLAFSPITKAKVEKKILKEKSKLKEPIGGFVSEDKM